MIPKLKMPLAYDQNLISASSSSAFQIDLQGHHRPQSLIDPDDLPADPKHAVWALAAAATTQQKRLPQKSSSTLPHSHQPPGTPTISTFSASNLGHIHIVQPYLPSASDISSNPTDSAGGNPALSHGCSTSTFSVHPTSASTPYSFSNPYCTNQLHGLIPGMGAGPGGPGQPPRPANAWILYRSDKMKDITPSLPGQPKPPQADISKLIAAMWKSEKPEVRQRYEALSDIKKAEHLALYPGYRFQPMKKADREKVRAERKAEKEKERLAAAVKGHRRPKHKRATTEETTATEDNDVENRQEPQGHSANPDATSPLSPTRMRTFAYQPYSVPSPGPASPSTTLVGAIPKRKRARTKAETPASVLPSDEQVSLELHCRLSPLTLLIAVGLRSRPATQCACHQCLFRATRRWEIVRVHVQWPTSHLQHVDTATLQRFQFRSEFAPDSSLHHRTSERIDQSHHRNTAQRPLSHARIRRRTARHFPIHRL
jgi:hypothetical protein